MKGLRFLPKASLWGKTGCNAKGHPHWDKPLYHSSVYFKKIRTNLQSIFRERKSNRKIFSDKNHRKDFTFFLR